MFLLEPNGLIVEEAVAYPTHRPLNTYTKGWQSDIIPGWGCWFATVMNNYFSDHQNSVHHESRVGIELFLVGVLPPVVFHK